MIVLNLNPTEFPFQGLFSDFLFLFFRKGVSMTGHKHNVGHNHLGVFRALIDMHKIYVIVEFYGVQYMTCSLFFNAFIII